MSIAVGQSGLNKRQTAAIKRQFLFLFHLLLGISGIAFIVAPHFWKRPSFTNGTINSWWRRDVSIADGANLACHPFGDEPAFQLREYTTFIPNEERPPRIADVVVLYIPGHADRASGAIAIDDKLNLLLSQQHYLARRLRQLSDDEDLHRNGLGFLRNDASGLESEHLPSRRLINGRLRAITYALDFGRAEAALHGAVVAKEVKAIVPAIQKVRELYQQTYGDVSQNAPKVVVVGFSLGGVSAMKSHTKNIDFFEENVAGILTINSPLQGQFFLTVITISNGIRDELIYPSHLGLLPLRFAAYFSNHYHIDLTAAPDVEGFYNHREVLRAPEPVYHITRIIMAIGLREADLITDSLFFERYLPSVISSKGSLLPSFAALPIWSERYDPIFSKVHNRSPEKEDNAQESWRSCITLKERSEKSENFSEKRSSSETLSCDATRASCDIAIYLSKNNPTTSRAIRPLVIRNTRVVLTRTTNDFATFTKSYLPNGGTGPLNGQAIGLKIEGFAFSLLLAEQRQSFTEEELQNSNGYPFAQPSRRAGTIAPCLNFLPDHFASIHVRLCRPVAQDWDDVGAAAGGPEDESRWKVNGAVAEELRALIEMDLDNSEKEGCASYLMLPVLTRNSLQAFCYWNSQDGQPNGLEAIPLSYQKHRKFWLLNSVKNVSIAITVKPPQTPSWEGILIGLLEKSPLPSAFPRLLPSKFRAISSQLLLEWRTAWDLARFFRTSLVPKKLSIVAAGVPIVNKHVCAQPFMNFLDEPIRQLRTWKPSWYSTFFAYDFAVRRPPRPRLPPGLLDKQSYLLLKELWNWPFLFHLYELKGSNEHSNLKRQLSTVRLIQNAPWPEGKASETGDIPNLYPNNANAPIHKRLRRLLRIDTLRTSDDLMLPHDATAVNQPCAKNGLSKSGDTWSAPQYLRQRWSLKSIGELHALFSSSAKGKCAGCGNEERWDLLTPRKTAFTRRGYGEFSRFSFFALPICRIVGHHRPSLICGAATPNRFGLGMADSVEIYVRGNFWSTFLDLSREHAVPISATGLLTILLLSILDLQFSKPKKRAGKKFLQAHVVGVLDLDWPLIFRIALFPSIIAFISTNFIFVGGTHRSPFIIFFIVRLLASLGGWLVVRAMALFLYLWHVVAARWHKPYSEVVAWPRAVEGTSAQQRFLFTFLLVLFTASFEPHVGRCILVLAAAGVLLICPVISGSSPLAITTHPHLAPLERATLEATFLLNLVLCMFPWRIAEFWWTLLNLSRGLKIIDPLEKDRPMVSTALLLDSLPATFLCKLFYGPSCKLSWTPVIKETVATAGLAVVFVVFFQRMCLPVQSVSVQHGNPLDENVPLMSSQLGFFDRGSKAGLASLTLSALLAAAVACDLLSLQYLWWAPHFAVAGMALCNYGNISDRKSEL